MVAIADSNPELAAQSAARAVALLVREMGLVVGPVDVARLRDDAAAVAREAMEAP